MSKHVWWILACISPLFLASCQTVVERWPDTHYGEAEDSGFPCPWKGTCSQTTCG